MSSTALNIAASRGAMESSTDPIEHRGNPIVTGTSVVAIKYKDGVMMVADTLGSYGSLARFPDVRRIIKSGPYTLIGAGGDISDFQFLTDHLNKMEVREKFSDDGLRHTPEELYHHLTRLLYFRRSKMNPLWNSLVIGGHDGKKSFLGTTDLIGTAYECDFVATGFGMHLAMPILREKWTPGMSEADARQLLEQCMKVLFYRDCRTINRFTFSKSTAAGPVIEEPKTLETEWGYAAFEKPYL